MEIRGLKIFSVCTAVLLIVTMLLAILPFNKVEASDTKFEYYSSGLDNYTIVGLENGDYIIGQTFTPQTTHYLTSIKLKMHRTGSPATIYCFLFATSGGLPVAPYLRYDDHNGNAITTDTGGEWVEFVFDTGYTVNAGTKYAIVLSAPSGDAGNCLVVQEDVTSPTYTRGNRIFSTDGAISFSADTGIDIYFEEYGTLPVTIPTLTTEAASVVTATTATGNATITSLGNGTVTKRGIVYSSTDTTPTIAEGADYVEETSAGFTAVAFTENLTGLSTGVTYYARGYAYNSAGYGYGSAVSFTCSVSAPTITALEASQVAKTSARLNSIIPSDGGEDCEIRFGYGTTTQAAVDFASYDTVSSWVDGYNSSEQPYLDITSLTASTTYYYRIQIKNSDGTVTSDEIDFTTLDAVSPAENFSGIPDVSSITLSWIKGAGATKSMIRYSFDAYPATNADGTLLYFSTGTTVEHTGLASGVIVYYTIWCESGDTYSTAVNLLVTTLAGTVTTTTIAAGTIEEPTNWFADIDYTTMSNFEPFYTAINDLADSISMSYDAVWIGMALIFSMAIGFLAFTISGGKLLIGGICLCGAMGLFSVMKLMPLYMILLVIVVILGFGLSRRTI